MGGERFLLFQLQCFMWEMMKMESTDQNRLVQVPIVSASMLCVGDDENGVNQSK